MNKKQTYDSKIITGSRSQTDELTSAEKLSAPEPQDAPMVSEQV